jgi:hypothetical protein
MRQTLRASVIVTALLSGIGLALAQTPGATPGRAQQGVNPVQAESTSDPLVHTRNMAARLTEITGHLRQDIDKVDDPQFKAMFEAAAETLTGLVTAFRHYEQKNERAWTGTPATTGAGTPTGPRFPER